MSHDTLAYSGQDNRIDDNSNLAANIVNRGIVNSLQNGIRSNSSMYAWGTIKIVYDLALFDIEAIVLLI